MSPPSRFTIKRGGRRSLKWPDINFVQVATEVGISHSHLCNIVAGVCQPSIQVAIRLAEVWSAVVGRKVTVEGLENEFRKRKAKNGKEKAK